MILPRCLILAASVVVVAPAAADPRIATHFFQQSEVVTIHGRPDTQSTIAFAPDERIENVAVGDSNAWQVTPNKRTDLLFVKPTKPGARTNMTVVTDQRTYLFDLVVAPRTAAVYMLRFTYPAPAKAMPVAVVTAVAAPVVTPPPTPDPARLNFAWSGHGDKALLPSRSFDDGQATYLAWPADVALPAILAREPGGKEGPVNYTVQGAYIVVEGVPTELILRSGKQTATLAAAPKAEAEAPPGERTALNREAPARPFAHVADGRP